MDQQNWTAYPADAPVANRPRFAAHDMASPQHAQREAKVPSQIKQEAYASPTAPLRQSTVSAFNDRDGDISMEDADSYKSKMPRPTQQHRHSQQFLQHEESAAARRYSPMNLSPTSPYPAGAQQGGQGYTSFTPQAQAQTHSNRQSPTRNNPYMSPPNSYYSPPCTSSLSQRGLPAMSAY
jgi:dual specificity protein kinase YAK1